jgi:hypothetical protein
MAAKDLDVVWSVFMEEQGRAIQGWIADELEQTREIFDYQDGTHIKWVAPDRLGFLITLSTAEVDDLLMAWEDAHKGDESASHWLIARCAKAFAMLEAAVDLMDGDDDEVDDEMHDR